MEQEEEGGRELKASEKVGKRGAVAPQVRVGSCEQNRVKDLAELVN